MQSPCLGLDAVNAVTVSRHRRGQCEWIVISNQVPSQLVWRYVWQTKIGSFVTKSYTHKMGLKFVKLPWKSGELAALNWYSIHTSAIFTTHDLNSAQDINKLSTYNPYSSLRYWSAWHYKQQQFVFNVSTGVQNNSSFQFSFCKKHGFISELEDL